MYILNEHIVFPEISEADNEGLLAVGGDLSEQRLILAYQKGIFLGLMPMILFCGGALIQDLFYIHLKLECLKAWHSFSKRNILKLPTIKRF